MADVSVAELVEYRDIPQLTGYRAGSDGSIWCCRKRGGPGGLTDQWRLVKSSVRRKDGYMQVGASKVIGERIYTWKVHQLVLMAFVGPKPSHGLARHLDGDRTNNRLTNLEWGTWKENKAIDGVRLGENATGEQNGSAKLTSIAVQCIRKMKRLGYLNREIAWAFDIHIRTVIRIWMNQIWKEC